MGKIIGNNRKQLLYGDAVDPGKCIYIARSWNVETVVLLSKGEVDSKKIRLNSLWDPCVRYCL